MMHKCQHQAIFYPADGESLRRVCTPREPTTDRLTRLPAAIMVPHASYAWSLDLLHRGFASVRGLDPDLVVVLGSLHQEVLQEDLPHFVFAYSGDGIAMPDDTVHFASGIRDRLVADYPGGVAVRDSYFSEEPCVELTLPLANAYFPSVPVLPLLVGKPDAKGTKTLSAIIGRVTRLAQRPLFVLSANMTGILPASVADEHAKNLQTLLEAGTEPLLEFEHRGKISCCGIHALEAFRTQGWGKSSWRFLSFQCKDRQYGQLPEQSGDKEKIVWHCVALRGER